jgi:hypothetical protein
VWSGDDGWESREDIAKYEASPRKEMAGSPVSVGCEREFGIEDEAEVEGVWAAALPRDPWNWVDLDPQPTLMNLSEVHQSQSIGRLSSSNLHQNLQTVAALRGSHRKFESYKPKCPHLYSVSYR